jgi:hypothetical protein
MLVRKALATLGVILLWVTCSHASQLEADPHELYETARTHLRNGDLESAESLLARLRAMISNGSQWDPDGVFANQLLPPLLSKLKRMQAVTRQLDAFSERSLEELKPPEITDDASSLHRYTDWATSLIQRLRRERDRIVSTGLSDPQEQAALSRTTSYARTERLLEIDVLQKLADSTEDATLALHEGDPSIDPVLVRFRQLKLDLMRVMIERDRLEKQLNTSRPGDAAYLRALAALVTEGPLPARRGRKLRPADVSEMFGRHLDHELEAVRTLGHQTSTERDARREALGRYRRYNEVLTRAGLGTDQSRRIQDLTQAVEGCPVKDGATATSKASRWSHGLLTAALALVAAFSSWLAVARGRRLTSARNPQQPVGAVLEAPLPERDVRGNAA